MGANVAHSLRPHAVKMATFGGRPSRGPEAHSSTATSPPIMPDSSSSATSGHDHDDDSKLTETSINGIDDLDELSAEQYVDLMNVLKGGVQVRGDQAPAGQLRAFFDKSAASLRGLADQKDSKETSGQWERLTTIVDSGASITAVPPKTGKGYKAHESEASRKGVEYATAGNDTLPNLGEKFLAVMTKEGTLRGFRTQLADVTEPLESVRQLCTSKHCVLFGLGPDDDQHLIVNKVTGEVNVLRDDGVNYLHDLLIVPPGEVENVQKALQPPMPFGGQA